MPARFRGFLMWLWGLMALLSIGLLVEGGKVLVIPMEGSPWLSMRKTVQELHNRGHEIVVLVPEANLFFKTEDFFTLKSYAVSFTREELKHYLVDQRHTFIEEKSFLVVSWKLLELSKKVCQMFVSSCKELLNNKDLLASLKTSSFDVILADTFYSCSAIVAKYLSIPTVFFMWDFACDLSFKGTQCPNPLSYIPKMLSESSDHMTFLQRVKNVFYSWSLSFHCSMCYQLYATTASELLQREMSLEEILSVGSVRLLKEDFVVNYPRPIMPNMFFIGGITCADQKPLSRVCIGASIQ